jgi:nitroreductase
MHPKIDSRPAELLGVIRQRWSPRAFHRDQPLSAAQLNILLEAARWAPSASNVQPWRFLIGIAPDETYQKIFSTLVEFNQLWAGNAPVLFLNVADMETNRHGAYDLGQAVAQLALQAKSLGLDTHQMAGFDPDKARQLFAIPPQFAAYSVMAVGYRAGESILPDRMQKGELKPGERKALNELAFTSTWGQPFTEPATSPTSPAAPASA